MNASDTAPSIFKRQLIPPEITASGISFSFVPFSLKCSNIYIVDADTGSIINGLHGLLVF